MSKSSGLINRYAKVCNIILVEWTFETARFILPPPRFLSQPRRGGALFGLSKQEAKGGLRGRWSGATYDQISRMSAPWLRADSWRKVCALCQLQKRRGEGKEQVARRLIRVSILSRTLHRWIEVDDIIRLGFISGHGAMPIKIHVAKRPWLLTKHLLPLHHVFWTRPRSPPTRRITIEYISRSLFRISLLFFFFFRENFSSLSLSPSKNKRK